MVRVLNIKLVCGSHRAFKPACVLRGLVSCVCISIYPFSTLTAAVHGSVYSIAAKNLEITASALQCHTSVLVRIGERWAEWWFILCVC